MTQLEPASRAYRTAWAEYLDSSDTHFGPYRHAVSDARAELQKYFSLARKRMEEK